MRRQHNKTFFKAFCRCSGRICSFDIKPDHESQTICIRFNQKNGKKDSATFGGGPISDADWEERVKELFTSLGVIR